MDSNEFVEAIKIAVEKSSVQAMKELLTNPPGRKPETKVLKRSDWYNNLSEEDKNTVIEVIEESIKLTVFGFFCVLDGVRAIEDEQNKGELKLYYDKDGNTILINNPNEEYLHDIYSSTN